jgi:hypothetical protein
MISFRQDYVFELFLIRWKIILLLDEAERYEEVWRGGGVAPRIPNLDSR